MLRTITQTSIAQLMQLAQTSARKRTILRLHEHEEPVQRMVNAMLPGTYIPPHKHENPDKVELFSILLGRLAVVHLQDDGAVQQVVVLDAGGENRVVDIPPRTYHTLIPLQPSAALEIIQGPYDAATHKQFAPWAPAEDSPDAAAYLARLTAQVLALHGSAQ